MPVKHSAKIAVRAVARPHRRGWQKVTPPGSLQRGRLWMRAPLSDNQGQDQSCSHLPIPAASRAQHAGAKRLQKITASGLTDAALSATMADASTSLGEASARTKATDPERRKTPRVRTAPPGLRVEPKWLPDEVPDTPCSAKALTRGVPLTPLCTSDGAPVRPGRKEVRAK